MANELDDSIDDYWGTQKSTKRTLSPEHRQKISKAMKGKKKSSQHVENASQAHKAKGRTYTCTEKTKRKLSIAAMQFWDERKRLKP